MLFPNTLSWVDDEFRETFEVERHAKSLDLPFICMLPRKRPVQLMHPDICFVYERDFKACETAIFTFEEMRRTALDDTKADQLIKNLICKINAIEDRVNTKLIRTNFVRNLNEKTGVWIKFSYGSPPVKPNIRIRTKLANRLLNVFLKQDKLSQHIMEWKWSGIGYDANFEDEDCQFENEVSEMACLLASALPAK